MKNVRASLLLKVGLRGRGDLRTPDRFVDDIPGFGCGVAGFATGFKIDGGSLAGTGVGLLTGGCAGLLRGNAMVFSGSLAGAALDAPMPGT